LLAAGLRIPRLNSRPMHADEAILADKFGTMLAGGGFPYDPRDYHGPVLAYLAWIPAHLAGRTTYESLTETTLRIAPAITGILLAISPFLLTPVVGFPASLAASAMMAASPVLVYYSRDFIPEMPLALWTALFLAGLSKPRPGWRAFAGAAAVAMMATKETALLALVAAFLAKIATSPRRRPEWRGLVAFGAGAVAAFCILLASVNWALLAGFLTPYTRKAFSGGLHAHPWYSYLQWIAGWHYSFTEAPILVLASVGVVVAVKGRRPFVAFLAMYTLALLAEYSVLPYKTPWCAVSIVYGLALLAGVGAGALASKRRRVAFAAVVVAVSVSASQAWVASVPAAVDPGNPWAYAQTGNGVFSILDSVEATTRAAPDGRGVALDVYSRENWWPLPWYFRRYPHVRWWRQVDLQGRAAPIVLLSPEMEPDLIRKLYEGAPPGQRELYVNLFPQYVELRPQVEVRGYVAKSLWDRSRVASSGDDH
jgi:predicted membrane-bound mannosyltransferase